MFMSVRNVNHVIVTIVDAATVAVPIAAPEIDQKPVSAGQENRGGRRIWQ